MTQITLDSNATCQLDALTQPAEVCDPAGRVLGKFVPNAMDDVDPREFYPHIDRTMADAGGVGLNLQAADTVINLELPWNPAVLEQRVARVHRMGQNRPVRAIHFRYAGHYRRTRATSD